MGERYYLGIDGGAPRSSLLAQGRTAEAATQAADAERWSAEDDVEAQVLWRSVQARLRAAAGDGATAAALAAEAVDLAREADSPAMQADALTDLALVLEAGGHTAEAGAAARDGAALRRQGQRGVRARGPGDRRSAGHTDRLIVSARARAAVGFRTGGDLQVAAGEQGDVRHAGRLGRRAPARCSA